MNDLIKQHETYVKALEEERRKMENGVANTTWYLLKVLTVSMIIMLAMVYILSMAIDTLPPTQEELSCQIETPLCDNGLYIGAAQD